jgi:hypothetical protein
MKNYLALVITLLGSLLVSCDKNDVSESEFDNSVITHVEGPATAAVGQQVELMVTLQGNNGCAVSGQLQENIEGKTRVIRGKVNYQGEACHQALVPVVEIYKFQTAIKGTYELKFLKIDNTFVIHKITVN